MMQYSMKMYLALLWGICVWFSTESMSASIPETSSVTSTTEPNRTTKQLISHAETETQPTHKPAEVNAAATVQNTLTATATVGYEYPIVTYSSDSPNDSTVDLVAMNTAAATASSSSPRWFPAATVVITTASEAQPSHNTMITEPVKPTEEQLHQQSSTTYTEMTAPVTTPAITSATTPVTNPVTTPATTSATISALTSAASLTTVAMPLPQHTSTTKPEDTSTLSTTTSPADSTQAPVFIQNLTSPSASAMTTMTANPNSASTSLSVTVSETSTTSTEVLSTHQHISVTRTHISTSQFTDTAGSSSTTELPTTSFSTDSAISTTAAVPSSSAGILIPHVPKRRPIPTTSATTSVPCDVSKSPPSTEVQPCSTRSVKKQCLIAIASLAALATIFMVSTIVLCAKLSSRKYKVKKPKQATEMMCISALLPERNCTYTRQRSPVTNGVLVIHGGGDSDEDVGDNLTLSSFLPENDRFV